MAFAGRRCAAVVFMVLLGVGTNSILAFNEGLDDGFLSTVSTDWSERPAGSIEPAIQTFKTDSSLGAMSASVQRPQGALSDVIVYCSGGHGFTADTGNSEWVTQRPLLYGMVEDMGNIDQLNMFAEYCFNAGATVVPMRPVGHQTNEVVLDNDDGAVSFSGTWYDSSSTNYFGDPGDTPYRYAYASTNGETCYARYRPAIPEAGYYPVYTWVRSGSDRVKQVYRIHHAGGVAELTVNHRRVGLGWVWLGTYWFEAGTDGYVDISNDAPGYDPGNDVVIADAMRFGNGMGDVDRGFGVSGFERELECSRYWVQRSMGQGMSSTIYDLSGYSDQDDNVGVPRRMTETMNREADGDFWDRIYLGFHSNAGTGSGRGPVGLYDTRYPASVQSRQISFSKMLVEYLTENMEYGDNGVLFNDDWSDNTSSTYGSGYGELYGAISNEMNNTIIEVAFHDNLADSYLLRDACARKVMAWSCYQAIVEHLHTNNPSIPLAFAPMAPAMPAAVNTGDGSVTLSWGVPSDNGIGAGTATGYVVYVSSDGRAFGNPFFVNGGRETETVISNLTVDATFYFRITALSEGGESMPSETVGVRVTDAGLAQHLVVNGFDRCDRNLSPLRHFDNNLNGSVTMVRPEHINSYNYVIQHGEAIRQTNAWFDSCGHGALTNGAVALTNYLAAYWILGEESSNDSTFDSTEQSQVTDFLNAGGCLMASGAEIMWDLDHLGSVSDKAFAANMLHTAYASDDAGTNAVSASAGSVFFGLTPFFFQEGDGTTYSVDYPDTFTPINGAESALAYAGGATAATVFSNDYKTVIMGFPFETITSEMARQNLMSRVLEFFGTGEPVLELDDTSRTVPYDTVEWTVDGTCANVAGMIVWSNGSYSAGAFGVQSPWSFTATNLQPGANLIVVTASNATGVTVSRSLTITRSEYAFGNCWHIPANNEPGENTMRDPVIPMAFQTTYFFSGNQFTGEGNAANQTGGTLYYREEGAPSWNTATMSFDSESGQNKYYMAAVTGKTYRVGNEIEYYFEINYSDRDTSYIGTWDSGSNSAVFVVQSEAAENPFSFTYGGYPGNCWHIPDNAEPETVTMRNPTNPCAFQAVYIYQGNQYQGDGNAANQSGGALYYRKEGASSWTTASMVHDSVSVDNKYWMGSIPSNTFVTYDVIEYYIEVDYSDRDTTYLSLNESGESYSASAYRSFAEANPFVYTNRGYPGNCWHIPDNQEPGGHYMRDPQQEPDAAYPVTIRSGNQFAGAGNPGNQTGLTLYYRELPGGSWTNAGGCFEAEEGDNKYWFATIPGGTCQEGAIVQYYLCATYQNHDVTYISTDGAGNSQAQIEESVAQASPFSFTYASSAQLIFFQGFEGTSEDNWNLVSGEGYISTDAGIADVEPAAQRIRTGTHSWQRQDYTAADPVDLELEEISLGGYSNVKVYVHVSATDPQYSLSGMDDDDYVKVFIATNGAGYDILNPEITIVGFGPGSGPGVRWGYDAKGLATTHAGVPRSFQAESADPIVRINDGYSTIIIDIPNEVDSLSMKIETSKQWDNEYWNIDDIAVTGSTNDPSGSVPDAPLIQTPSEITESSFVASWSVVSNAADYLLDVADNALFRSGSSLPVEDFEGTFPSTGWYANSVIQTSKYANSPSQSGLFKYTSVWLVTPLLSGPKTLLISRYATSTSPELVVEYCTDWNGVSGSWTEITNIPTQVTDEWVDLEIDLSMQPDGYVRLSKASLGYLYLDDISVTAADGCADGYQIRNVGTATGAMVTGLVGNTHYYCRVRAQNAIGISGYSATQTVWTLEPEFTYASLTVTAGAHGSVVPSGTVQVVVGSNQSFTVTADAHYRISGIQTNSITIGIPFDNGDTNYVYTWENVQVDGSLDVEFTAIMVTNSPVEVPEIWLNEYYPAAENYEQMVIDDTDGDGMSAWQEYVAGTDPTDINSQLQAEPVGEVAAGQVISWAGTSETGHRYNIYWTDDLSSPFALLVEDLLSAYPEMNVYTDTAHQTESKLFYRVQVTKQE